MAYISKYSGEEFDSNMSSISKLADTYNKIQEDNSILSEKMNEIKTFQDSLGTMLLNIIYPIGSLYTSFESNNPKDIFGGTWEQIKDCFLLAAGDIYAIGTSGGESSTTLTTEEIPSHQHQLPFTGNKVADGTSNTQYNFIYGYGQTASEIGQKTEMYNPDDNYGAEGNEVAYLTSFVGSGEPHNNMPPYQTIFMWKRVG